MGRKGILGTGQRPGGERALLDHELGRSVGGEESEEKPKDTMEAGEGQHGGRAALVPGALWWSSGLNLILSQPHHKAARNSVKKKNKVSPLLAPKGKLRPRERLRFTQGHAAGRSSMNRSPLTHDLIIKSNHSSLLSSSTHPKLGYQDVPM